MGDSRSSTGACAHPKRAPVLQALVHMRGPRPRKCAPPGDARHLGHRQRTCASTGKLGRAQELRTMLSGLQHALPSRFGAKHFDLSGLQAAERQTNVLAISDSRCPVFAPSRSPLPARRTARGAREPEVVDSLLAEVLTAAADERSAADMQLANG